MSFFRTRTGAATCIALATAILTWVPGVHASSPAMPYKLTGSVSTSSADAFAGRPTTQMASTSRQVAWLLSPEYWIVSTVRPSGPMQVGLEATAGVPVALVEVSRDPASQQELVAVGAVSPSGIEWFNSQLAAATAKSSTSASSTLGDTRSAVVSPMGFVATHGFFSTFWTDPAGITLNSVIDEIHWSYNGSTVTNVTGNDSRQWLSGNFWSEISHSIGSYYNSPHTAGTVWTNDNFRTSSIFPPGCGTTNTYYQSNNAYGSNLGHIGGGVNTWATSGCLGLLSVTAFASPGS